jgi:LysM repeat protein
MDDDREGQNGRDRRRALRSGTSERPSTRRGYAFPRAEHRHPVYGRQARRENRQMPYIIGFIVVVLGLAGFLYVGLNWATGPGRVAALANPPTPTAIAVLPPPTPEPSPTAVFQTYIVQAGDSPASIAAKFKIKTEDLVAANSIDDPQKLQIGQKLQIPPPAPGH